MKEVIVDTSVWLRVLAGKQPYLNDLTDLSLSERYRVLGHEIVYGELLIGDKGARAAPLSTYAKLRFSKTIPHQEVVELVRARRLYGIGIGWNDAHLLASALACGAVLYTADVYLHKAAIKLAVAYRPS